jgi:hypothetical protein
MAIAKRDPNTKDPVILDIRARNQAEVLQWVGINVPSGDPWEEDEPCPVSPARR